MSPQRLVTRAVGRTSASAPSYRVEIRTGTHQLVSDEPVGSGGGDTGPNPFRLFLSGLVACTAITLRMYAQRKGWNVESIEVRVDYEVAEDGQAHVERTITLPADLTQEQRDRLADIAERTPVTLAVKAGTPITTTIAVDGR